MELIELGRSGIRISPIVMGMWQAGKEMWTGIDDTEIRRAVHAAVEAGINAFDTAEMYGKGHSERMLAAATADIRDKVVYMTKVFSNHLQYDQVIAACNRSLKNLKTDRIDLYQIHWPSGSWGSRPVAIEETMRALNDLKAQGKIRAIGVSNFSRAQLEEAAGFGRIDSFQPPYSLFWRHVEKESHALLPGQQRHDPRLFTHGPGNPDRQFGPRTASRRATTAAGHRLFQPDLLPVSSGPGAPAADRGAQRRHTRAAGPGLGDLPPEPAPSPARAAPRKPRRTPAPATSLSAADVAEMDAIGRTVTDRLDGNPVQWNF